MTEPRLRVAAVVLHEGRVVLARHRSGDAVYHLLPGGGVEPGESLRDALAREFREETGLIVEIDRPLFISDTIAPDVSRHVVNITFLAHVTGGAVTATPDDRRVEAVDLVDPDGISGLDLRPPMAPQLREAIDSGFTDETRYLGTLWIDRDDA